MAVEKKAIRVGASWTRQYNPDTGQIEPLQGVIPCRATGLTGLAIEQAKAATEALDTLADLGNPTVGSNMDVRKVTQYVRADGKSFGSVILGRSDLIGNWGAAYQRKPQRTAWSAPFQINVTRYMKAGTSGTIAAAGEAVEMAGNRPVTITVSIPCVRVYRLEITDTMPADAGSGVGSFVNINGYTDAVKKLGVNVEEYVGPDDTEYHIVTAYEYRGTQTVNGVVVYGWAIQGVKADGTLWSFREDVA